MGNHLKRVFARLEQIEHLWTALEDRVGVLEEITIEHEGRLEDLEEGAEEDQYLKDD
jgi:hypothetical protein